MIFNKNKIRNKGILSLIVFSFVFMSSQSPAKTKDFNSIMSDVMSEYLKIHQKLADDKTEGVQESAKLIHQKSKELRLETAPKEHHKNYKNIHSQMMESSMKLEKAKDISEMRKAFNTMSKPMANWTQTHQPKGMGVYYCSMAKGSWVQKEGALKNPYYGHSMLSCGEQLKHHNK